MIAMVAIACGFTVANVSDSAIERQSLPIRTTLTENTAYLPEHFVWNDIPQYISGMQFPVDTVVIGLAPTHRELPNLHIIIPDGTRAVSNSIAAGGFSNRPNLIEVTIPASVERMDGQAFINTSVSTITVLPGPNLHTSLSAFMFRGAPIETINWEGSDTHQVVNNTVMFLGNQLELGLVSGYIPPETTSIRNNAFDGRGLSGEFVLPASVQQLGQDVFINNDITTLTILPGSNLGGTNNAFGNNPLATINFEGSPSLELRGGNIMGRWSNDLLVGTTAGHIPHGTTRIRWGAFQGRGLTGTIAFPNTVTSIDLQAFWNNSIDTLFFRGAVPSIDGVAFVHNNIRHIRFGRGTVNIPNLRDIPGFGLESVIIPASVVNMPAPTRIATSMDMTQTVDQWLDWGATEITIDGHQYLDIWGETSRISEVGLFGNHPNLVIYTEHPSRPEGWHENFDIGTSGTVVWGHPMWNDITVGTTGQGAVAVSGDYGNYLTQVTIGDERVFAATPDDGWEFVRFEITENDTTANDTASSVTLTMGSENISLNAVFEAIDYNIIYNLNGGTHTGNPDVFSIGDLDITLQDATRYGFDFLGWYTNPEFYGSPVTQITAIGDVRLYARWSNPLVSSITYHNLSDTDVHTNPATFVAADLPIALTGVTRSGWTFYGWYIDDGFGQPITQITSFGDISVYALVTINELVITFQNLQGATLNNQTVFTAESASTTLNNPGVRNGWTFEGWWTGANGTGTQWTNIAVGETGSQTLYAHWSLNEYTIRFNNLLGGTHSNLSVFDIETPTITLTDASRAGYRFGGWWTEPVDGTQITQIEPYSLGNRILYARWSIDFTDDETGITAEQGSGGEIIVTVPGSPDTVIIIYPDDYPAVTISPPNNSIIVDGPAGSGETTITIPGDYDDEYTIIIVRPGEDPPVIIEASTPRFTVSFDSGYGLGIPFQRVMANTIATMPTPTRILYRLLGWSLQKSGETRELFDFESPIIKRTSLYAVWERILIDDSGTGIIVEPGITGDYDNPGQDGDIVIIVPDDDYGGIVIIIRPDPDSDGEYKIIVTPPNDGITIEKGDEGEIIITIQGDDEGDTAIIVRPGKDPPVTIIPPHAGDDYPNPTPNPEPETSPGNLMWLWISLGVLGSITVLFITVLLIKLRQGRKK